MSDVSTQPTVGWIGTGRMGAAMAARLARAGVDLHVWNRTRAKAEPLTEHGATVVDGIADLAGREIVFVMVSADQDLEQVLCAEGGLLRQDQAPQVVVDTSTVSTETSARMRAECAERGTEFLASPVSGNAKVVGSGKLTLACSGREDVFDRVHPLLDHIGMHATYVGEGEVARLVKICHNLMLGVVTQNMAEITDVHPAAAAQGLRPRSGGSPRPRRADADRRDHRRDGAGHGQLGTYRRGLRRPARPAGGAVRRPAEA
jgi:3-hydroxyisobutyrate dehydrogenase